MVTDNSFILRTEHLNKKVPSGDSEITILHAIDLAIAPSDSIAIMGASGSGKTTLLTLLAGLDLPTSGDIYLQNKNLTQLTEDERTVLRAKQIGFIFQSFQLLPTLTALENVMLPLELHYTSAKEAARQATEWLAKVNLSKRLHHFPHELSGGEQQRVAIARAFVNCPTLIFADEMTGNLDNATGKLVSDLLFDLNKEHRTTLVLVTHDMQLANRCSKKYLLQQGKLQAC